MLEEILKKYEIVMGLEVHAQLKTKTKLMSGADNVYGQGPNTAVSTICYGPTRSASSSQWCCSFDGDSHRFGIGV